MSKLGRRLERIEHRVGDPIEVHVSVEGIDPSPEEPFEGTVVIIDLRTSTTQVTPGGQRAPYL